MTSELIPAEFRGNLGFLVAKAKQLLSDELDVALRDSGLQIRHFAVLSLIRRRAGLRQTDLCEVLGVDRTTMVKVVDDLEGAGLLRREPHAADRRAHALQMTEAGEQWHSRTLVPVMDHEQQFLAPLSPGERALLQEMLTRLVDSALVRSADQKQAHHP